MNTTFDTLFSGERQRTRSRIFGACFGLGFLTLFFFAGIDLAHAASKPLTGWAWSENVGWVSFSSENDTDPVATGVQKSQNLFGVFVEDAANALLSGYAWSEHVGWVSFNAGELSGCPSGECSARSNNGVLEGWARVCAGKGDDTSNVFYPNQTTPNNSCSGVSRTDGWDGWISLKGPSHIIVLNTSTGIYDGYAWGSDVVGWVDFDIKVDADTTGTLTPPPLEKDWCGTNAVEVYKKSTGGFDTWTPPANLSSATIKLWGGGGRGGKSYSVGSGGGGGGGYSEYTLTVNPALAYTLYVGRGGAGSRAAITGGQSTPVEFGEYTEFDITRVGGTPPTPNGVYRAGGGASGDPAGNFVPRQGGLGATTNGGAGGQGITNAGGGGGAGAGPGGSLANQNGNGGHGGETFNGAGGVGLNGGRGGHGGGVDFSVANETPPPLTFDYNSASNGQTSTNGTYTWTAPAGVTAAIIEVWGGGGSGGTDGDFGASGGGGGGYRKAQVTVTPGSSYSIHVGRGLLPTVDFLDDPAYGESRFAELIKAFAGGLGDSPSPGSIYDDGGAGGTSFVANGVTSLDSINGEQGKPHDSSDNGYNDDGVYSDNGGNGGAGGNGGSGGKGTVNATPCIFPQEGSVPGGGGGGGGGGMCSYDGRNGANGRVKITYTTTNPDSSSSRYAESGQAPGGGGGGMQYSPGDGAAGQLVVCAPKVTLTPPVVSSALGACGGNTKVWWSEVANATNYKLYRSSSSGTLGTEIGSFSAVKTQASPHLDSGLTPGDVYYYTVVASQGVSTSQGVKSQAASAACIFKPKVELYISPSGNCGTLKSANIIKGSPAKICWTVSSVPAN